VGAPSCGGCVVDVVMLCAASKVQVDYVLRPHLPTTRLRGTKALVPHEGYYA
jgi:hypothetical protein